MTGGPGAAVIRGGFPAGASPGASVIREGFPAGASPGAAVIREGFPAGASPGAAVIREGFPAGASPGAAVIRRGFPAGAAGDAYDDPMSLRRALALAAPTARPVAALTTSLIAIVALFLCPGAALAGSPGTWTRVTGIEGVEAVNTDELGLERTADGVLHVAWTRKVDALADTLLQSAIAANGKSVSPPVTIFGGSNNGMNNSVDLVAGPGGGLRVLFSGLFPETPLDVVLSTAVAPEAGTIWSPPAPASNTKDPSAVYVAAGIGGAVSPAGTVAAAWGDSGPGEGGYHVGVNPLDPDVHLSPAADEVDPNVGFDSASGAGYVAWNHLPGSGPNAVMAMPLGGGATMTAPKSGAAWLGQRVSIVGRSGGGVYLAYGSGGNPYSANPAWWKLGAPSANVVSGQKDAGHTGLAAGSGGRLWLFWDRKLKVYAARTNAAATKLGQVVSIKPPKGTGAIYRLNAEGSSGPLDLLTLAEAKGGLGYFHQRILPGLTFTAKPQTVKAGKKLTFKASDAGQPVKGAKVILALGNKKLTKKTNGKGKATIAVPAKTKPHKYSATAKKGGYTPAKLQVRVKS